MQRFGVYLIVLGIGSAVLSAIDYEFRILMWMDQMGNGAWLVRGLMVAAGAAMIGATATQNRAPRTVPAVVHPPQPHGYATPQPQQPYIAPQPHQIPAPQPAPQYGAPQPAAPPPAPSVPPAAPGVVEF